MGIVNRNVVDLNAAIAAASNSTASTKQDKPKSQLWLNVGVLLKGKGENGEDLFVSPFGIALDDLKQEEVRRPDTQYGKMQQLKNHLRELMQKECADLAPGESALVPLLTVEIRRKGEAGDATGNAEENELLAAFNSMLPAQ